MFTRRQFLTRSLQGASLLALAPAVPQFLANTARAAEAGWQGTVDEARDYELVFNGGGGSVRFAGRELAGAATVRSAPSLAEPECTGKPTC